MLAEDRKNLDLRDGNVINKTRREIVCTVEDITMKLFYDYKNPQTLTKEAYYSPTTNALTFGAAFTEVTIDASTGKVEIEKITAIIDCGKVINPDLAEGQVEGGTAMSVAYGLYEEILIDEKQVESEMAIFWIIKFLL
ncbi:hypothetical protein AZF37_06220 [endosymbiont 'TC1' of Trimyema compressum]|nr:molybdopterin cofactor-binding domain-containing protein [endosymbiont 'TC1' of Trimyema compressum]AMP20820.1 hypothetical protein AZF37_06220 [endosymbiont 'TC1' of Trimyema compressum]